MRKCNLRGIMWAAWRLYRSGTVSFSLALRKNCVAKRKSPPRRHGGRRNRRGNPHMGRVEAVGL